MSKDIKDYLHLYLGCEAKVPGQVVKLTAGLLADWDFVHYGIKPLFRPLSDMTEEEALEYAKVYHPNPFPANYNVSIKMHESGSVHVSIENDSGGLSLFPGGPHGDRPEAFRYLLSKHFDLFNLIPEGLAIDATKIPQPLK